MRSSAPSLAIRGSRPSQWVVITADDLSWVDLAIEAYEFARSKR
jgi:hypothetical protein